MLLSGLHKIDGLDVNLEAMETNLVFCDVNKPGMTAHELTLKMRTVEESEHEGTPVIVQMLAVGKRRIRLALHHQVSTDDVRKALEKFQLIMAA